MFAPVLTAWFLAMTSVPSKLVWTLRTFDPSPKEAPSVAIAAARTGHLDVLKFLQLSDALRPTMLLHRLFWLPSFLPMGTTACHEAASCGHSQVLHWLLDQRADPQALDNRRCSLAHLAAIHGHVEVLKILNNKGLDLSQRHANSTNVLHQAAFGGHVSAMQLLISCSLDVNAGDGLDQTPLHYAAMRGHQEVMLLLLQHGADLNLCDHRGRIPLHASAQGVGHDETVLVPLAAAPPSVRDQNLEAVALLLDWKADLEAKDCDGQTAYDLAARHPKVRDLLRNKTDVALVLVDNFAGKLQSPEHRTNTQGACSFSPIRTTPVLAASHHKMESIFLNDAQGLRNSCQTPLITGSKGILLTVSTYFF